MKDACEEGVHAHPLSCIYDGQHALADWATLAADHDVPAGLARTIGAAILAWNGYHHTMRQLMPADAWVDEALPGPGARRTSPHSAPTALRSYPQPAQFGKATASVLFGRLNHSVSSVSWHSKRLLKVHS